MIDPQFRLAAAVAVAHEAGALASRYYQNRENLTVESKGLQDIVSEADRQVETLIRNKFASMFPRDGMVGEEHDTVHPEADGGYWVVDPIDGTWCFLNGIGSWCVSIAYVRSGVIETGVIYDPCANELFAASKGLGATLNGRPVQVAGANSLTDGSVSVGYSMRSSHDLILTILGRLVRAGGVYHRHGSGALGLAWTACGRLIGYIEPHMNSWDCLAGYLLVQEAGGWTNDFLAGEGLFEGNTVVAGPQGLREALCALVASD